jgi:dTDP-4-dehydrorhamnose 3,5-epimerase
MQIETTPLQDCLVINNRLFHDERGYFFESFNAQRFEQATGLKTNFVQDNQSYSTFGVVRGLHFQTGAHAQAKLVRVLKGKVLDVAVDLRKSSPTFGQHFGIELDENNARQLFVPRGFAHGFIVLSETAHFFYKCDNFYHKESESGILYNDPALQIDWQLAAQQQVANQKDLELPTLAAATDLFD